MTVSLNGEDIAKKIAQVFPDSIASTNKTTIVVDSKLLHKVAEYLKTTPEFSFDYLVNLTAVDYIDFFEIVYHLVSIQHNHSLILKTRCYDRNSPVASSVYDLWRTADYQERELFDLFGIKFEGHPNLKRLFLWEGFEGYPLRRDYL